MMRITLTIDDDVLAVARDLAERQRRSVGEVVSDLARQSIRRPALFAECDGMPVLPVSHPEAVITLEMVNALRDEDV